VRDKYVDDDASWVWAEALLRGVLAERGIDYEDCPGHAAFYGPKIDIQVRRTHGSARQESLSVDDFELRLLAAIAKRSRTLEASSG
jgi:threonyl-tRNA synthetase